MALSRRELLRLLQQFEDEELEGFKFHLREKQQGAVMTYEGIPPASLQRASREQIADLMHQLYTSDLAQITASVLYEMGKFGLLQRVLGRTLSSPAPAETQSLQVIRLDRPSAPALRYFPQEFVEFIVCWSQNQEKMSRIVSDLNHIQTQIRIRSQQFRMPTETIQSLLGAAVSYMLSPGIALTSTLFLPFSPGFALFFAASGAIATGEGYMILQQIQSYFDLKRARELEKELVILLLQLMFKLVPLLSHLRLDSRALVQRVIDDIQEVLQRSYTSRSESGSEWILMLAEQGPKMLTDLNEIQETLNNS